MPVSINASDSDCVIVRNRDSSAQGDTSIIELTAVELQCSLYFINPFTIPNSPLLATGPATAYNLLDPGNPPFRIPFHQSVMSFTAFQNAVVEEIGSFAPGNQLRDALNVAARMGHIQWVYTIKEVDGSRKWTAEARLADKFPEFVAAARTFPMDARLTVALMMDNPERNNEIENVGGQPVARVQLAPQSNVGGQPVAPESGPATQIDFTLPEFFALCKIDFANKQIQALIKKNLILHWRCFRGASLRKIESLGFKSASPLIYKGTKKAIHETESH
ncbi:hypothetical protein PCANC_18197 [Puccinia coronata f. sp. avenae]|uniref:Uncharacterized protein n=1 Tax=Puccinia coronata f. sp. avenae TaxID=200324 RepID=A0A2N5SJX9_9BASI|nr:hypothetical protein PCANC_18197 [Puccinia coronata f. sp. avenae]